MTLKEKKHFFIAGLLYVVLIILIYFGSYIKFLLNHSWDGTAAAIVIIFLWITIFIIATIVAARGVTLIKERWRGKQRLDFVAWMGVMIADYSNSKKKMDLFGFFKEICKENGIMEAPNLKKYFDAKKKNLIGTRESVFEQLRQEIEDAATQWSNEKKKE
jgi:TM2 domain-containing membrane protein YozV